MGETKHAGKTRMEPDLLKREFTRMAEERFIQGIELSREYIQESTAPDDDGRDEDGQDEDWENNCYQSYHQGQSPRETQDEWEYRIHQLIMRPHGDDGACDHPVTQQWVYLLDAILTGAENAREKTAAREQEQNLNAA